MQSIDRLLRDIWLAAGGAPEALAQVRFASTDGALPSVFPVSDLAAACFAACGLALHEWLERPDGVVDVDRRLASLWFGFTLRPCGWNLPSLWDAVAGDYRTTDGWIRLHTNAPAHRAAALRVLGVAAEREAVARAVAGWQGEALETSVVEAGGCAALMSSPAQWRAHPQGAALAREPLIARMRRDAASALTHILSPERPLAGIRVLDLTRVIAGPVASRFLAGCGAEVLRIDPPDWDEPGLVPEVVPGKRCARLDLRRAADRTTFEALLAGADVLVHGYRPGALEGLGWDAGQLARINPALVEVRLDAWGWSGPWAGRRGFDSLVQMRSGIAHAGMVAAGAERPVPLPVQALDHAAGYVLATAALRGLSERRATGCGSLALVSLARVAALLTADGVAAVEPPLAAESAADLAAGEEDTAWGAARRLAWPLRLPGVRFAWRTPARGLGADLAAWV